LVLRLESNVILIDYKNFVSKSDKLIHIIFHDINFKNDLVKSFINKSTGRFSVPDKKRIRRK